MMVILRHGLLMATEAARVVRGLMGLTPGTIPGLKSYLWMEALRKLEELKETEDLGRLICLWLMHKNMQQ